MNATLFPPGAVRPRETSAPAATAVTDNLQALEPTFQVILHNDDHNDAAYVVLCLMKVFSHGQQLAFKIMMEAHTRGRSIAEVEAETPAMKHRDQLRSLGLSATVERVA